MHGTVLTVLLVVVRVQGPQIPGTLYFTKPNTFFNHEQTAAIVLNTFIAFQDRGW
jgi:hypothetical protein